MHGTSTQRSDESVQLVPPGGILINTDTYLTQLAG
jgi:hypothetical protein